MEAGGGAFNLGVASSPQEGRRKKTRRAGRKRKDARHRKVAEKRGMTDERRVFEVGEVLHALVFQLSVADVSFLPLEELGDKPKLHDDGLGDFALQERRAHWMTEPYLCASLPIRPHRRTLQQRSLHPNPVTRERPNRPTGRRGLAGGTATGAQGACSRKRRTRELGGRRITWVRTPGDRRGVAKWAAISALALSEAPGFGRHR